MDTPVDSFSAPPRAGSGLPRRRFLVAGGAATAASLIGISCSDDGSTPAEPVSSSSTSAPERARQFFSPREAAIVEAATARILPGTPDDPGAREAEVVVYIDALLASGGWGSEPIYRMPPFISPEEVADSSEDDDDLGTTSYGVTRRPIGTRDRWGEQSMLTPAEAYRAALPALDAYSTQTFTAGFLDLTEAQQDQVLADLEDGVPTNFPPEPSSRDFFALLRAHTLEGMFSDPIYGGNRDLVGWKLIGWPGAQRAYSVAELQTPQTPRSPRGIADLARYHAGHTDRDEPVFPLAGTEEHEGVN